MEFFRKFIEDGFWLGWLSMIAIYSFVSVSWIVGILALVVLGVWIWLTKGHYKEAKRVGLMTRAEHRTELRHEAELQSIWESK